MPVLVGTSGWQYKDWRGRFYPERLAQSRWLEHYASRFATVESNNAFYRLPEPHTFAQWSARTPPDFVMATKASRFLTHARRLRDPAEPVGRFLEHAGHLGDKLGPVLLQLPPSLRADASLLAATLECFPGRIRVALEPRHQSWFSGHVPDGQSAQALAGVAHGRLDIPAVPRGHGHAPALLRPAGAGDLGRGTGGDLGPGRRRLRLLQQRHRRLRRPRRHSLRRRGPPRRPVPDPDPRPQ
jgi:uncharacterized protein YecE (DUF72 family)